MKGGLERGAEPILKIRDCAPKLWQERTTQACIHVIFNPYTIVHIHTESNNERVHGNLAMTAIYISPKWQPFRAEHKERLKGPRSFKISVKRAPMSGVQHRGQREDTRITFRLPRPSSTHECRGTHP